MGKGTKPKRKKAKRDANGHFLPGQSMKGFTPGRPKGSYSLTRILKEELQKPGKWEGETKGHDLVRSIMGAARSRNGAGVAAAKEVLNRIDGKVPDIVVSDAGFLRELNDEDLDKLLKKGKE